MTKPTKLRCWNCGATAERINPALEQETTLKSIPGRYLTDGFCEKCSSRFFIPTNGKLPPVLGRGPTKISPSAAEALQTQTALREWNGKPIPSSAGGREMRAVEIMDEGELLEWADEMLGRAKSEKRRLSRAHLCERMIEALKEIHRRGMPGLDKMAATAPVENLARWGSLIWDELDFETRKKLTVATAIVVCREASK